MPKRPSPWGPSAVLAALVVACCLPVPRDGGPAPEPAEPSGLRGRLRAPERPGTEVLKFAWSDINARPVAGRRGDSFEFGRATTPDRHRVTYEMDLRRLKESVDAYGIPTSWVTFQYGSEREKWQRFGEVRERAASRGIALEMDGNTVRLSADPAWIVSESREDLAPLTQDLHAEAVRSGLRDWRGFLGVAASFVQGIEYRLPPDERPGPGGMSVNTCGVEVPLETLSNGWGDCDTKCFLLGALLASVEDAGAVLLEGEQHMFIGVACAPRPYDRYVTLQGIDYVLVEVTTPWPLGSVPRDIENGMQANRYRVRRFDLGR